MSAEMNQVMGVAAGCLVERNDEVTAIVRALVAREHVLLVGPPGCGKSLACRTICQCIDGIEYVERLLSPTTDPDEVWGPIDPVEYRNTGRYVRRSAGYVPSAHVFFADEFFRASDSIRDTMLHLLGPERQTLVDGQQIRTPLITAIGATNTWAESATQSAILDRWLIRRVVKPVSRAGRNVLMFDALPTPHIVATLQDLHTACSQAEALPMSDDAKSAAQAIMDGLQEQGIRPSDRRTRGAMRVARAAAYLAGHLQVEVPDLDCLVDVLWDQPDQRDKAAEVIMRVSNPDAARLNEILLEVDQIVANCGDDQAKRLEAVKKLQTSMKEAEKLKAKGLAKADAIIDHIKAENTRLQALAMGMDPAKIAEFMAAVGSVAAKK